MIPVPAEAVRNIKNAADGDGRKKPIEKAIKEIKDMANEKTGWPLK